MIRHAAKKDCGSAVNPNDFWRLPASQFEVMFPTVKMLSEGSFPSKCRGGASTCPQSKPTVVLDVCATVGLGDLSLYHVISHPRQTTLPTHESAGVLIEHIHVPWI
jgi:hypothetical protein